MKVINEEKIYTPVTYRITTKRDLTSDVRFFQMVPTGEFKHIDLDYNPGQFMMLSLFGTGEAPFSITSSPTRKGIIEFAIRKVGKITDKIFTLKDGDLVGLRGPFGNGFPVEKMEGEGLIIVAGGLGAAPLRSLLLYALDNRELFKRVIFIYGCRNMDEMLYKPDFMEMLNSDQVELFLTVDRGNQGYEGKVSEGLVTGLISKLENIDPDSTVAVVCGPPVMYKFVVDELLKFNLRKNNIFLSLDRRMKCGIGKCGHCSIDYIYTCIEGPVFSYWDVLHFRDLI
jgi:sulfhydrogenase subunit gamma (sulfur reductase)